MLGKGIEFLGCSICISAEMACRLNHSHLHAKAYAQVGYFSLSGELGCLHHAIYPSSAKTTRANELENTSVS
jgi:hypothetical protein